MLSLALLCADLAQLHALFISVLLKKVAAVLQPLKRMLQGKFDRHASIQSKNMINHISKLSQPTNSRALFSDLRGYPAHSHHDKIPPWWGNVSNDKGGNVSVSNSHHT